METEHKKLDQFTKEVIKDAGIALPSADFLANVMTEVAKENVSTTIRKPLISKIGWIIIMSLFVMFAFVLTRFSLGFEILGNWNLSSLYLEKYHINWNFNMNIPVTYAYGFFFLMIFVVIQIRMIQKFFSRSLIS